MRQILGTLIAIVGLALFGSTQTLAQDAFVMVCPPFPGMQPGSCVATYTHVSIDQRDAAIRDTLNTQLTQLATRISQIANESNSLAESQRIQVNAVIEKHQNETLALIKAIVTPELVAEIEKSMIPKVRAAVIEDLQQQGLLNETR